MTSRYVHPQGEVINEAFTKISERQKVVIAPGHSEKIREIKDSPKRPGNVG